MRLASLWVVHLFHIFFNHSKIPSECASYFYNWEKYRVVLITVAYCTPISKNINIRIVWLMLIGCLQLTLDLLLSSSKLLIKLNIVASVVTHCQLVNPCMTCLYLSVIYTSLEVMPNFWNVFDDIFSTVCPSNHGLTDN